MTETLSLITERVDRGLLYVGDCKMAAKATLGWRVYAPNAPAAQLDLRAAVVLYRDE